MDIISSSYKKLINDDSEYMADEKVKTDYLAELNNIKERFDNIEVPIHLKEWFTPVKDSFIVVLDNIGKSINNNDDIDIGVVEEYLDKYENLKMKLYFLNDISNEEISEIMGVLTKWKR